MKRTTPAFDPVVHVGIMRALAARENMEDAIDRVLKRQGDEEDQEEYHHYRDEAELFLTALQTTDAQLAIIPLNPPESALETITHSVMSSIEMLGDWIGQLEWQSDLGRQAYLATLASAPFLARDQKLSSNQLLPGDVVAGASGSELVAIPKSDIENLLQSEPGSVPYEAAKARIETYMVGQEDASSDAE